MMVDRSESTASGKRMLEHHRGIVGGIIHGAGTHLENGADLVHDTLSGAAHVIGTTVQNGADLVHDVV